MMKFGIRKNGVLKKEKESWEEYLSYILDISKNIILLFHAGQSILSTIMVDIL